MHTCLWRTINSPRKLHYSRLLLCHDNSSRVVTPYPLPRIFEWAMRFSGQQRGYSDISTKTLQLSSNFYRKRQGRIRMQCIYPRYARYGASKRNIAYLHMINICSSGTFMPSRTAAHYRKLRREYVTHDFRDGYCHATRTSEQLTTRSF